jgi:hypothetical protein
MMCDTLPNEAADHRQRAGILATWRVTSISEWILRKVCTVQGNLLPISNSVFSLVCLQGANWKMSAYWVKRVSWHPGTQERSILGGWFRQAVPVMCARLMRARTVAACFALATRLLEVLRPVCRRSLSWLSLSTRWAASSLWQTLARHERQIIRVGRLMLIGYSSLILVLTLGVIATIAWRHSPGVNRPPLTARSSKPDTKVQEEGNANTGRSAYSVSISR